MSPIRVETPTIISIIPMNFAQILKKNIIIFPRASKKERDVDCTLLPTFW